MNCTTDNYRTALGSEIAQTTSAAGTFAVTELNGLGAQTRVEVARFSTLALAVAGRDVMNLLAKDGRRYKSGPSLGSTVDYRSTCANELAQATGGATHAVARIYGDHGLGQELVARFGSLANAQAARDTLNAAARGGHRYEVVIL